MTEDAAGRFVPTIERARKEGVELPDGEPFESERWAALFVLAAVVRRRSWKDRVYYHPRAAEQLGRGEPAAPSGFADATHMTVGSIQGTLPCPACVMTPGLRKCRVCAGSGTIYALAVRGPVACSCSKGYVACPTCLGEKTTALVDVRYHQDTVAIMREFWLPSHLPCYAPLFGLERAMEEAAQVELAPPEELRCHDLSGRTAGTAYRGGEKTVRPSFRGHDFGDTIDRALTALKALGGGYKVVLHDTRAYAWPVLRLRYANPREPERPVEVALYCDRDGGLRSFSGKE